MNHIFTVEGMTCAHCERAITHALLTLDPQSKVVVDLHQNQVQVVSEQKRSALAQAMMDEGYRVTV